MNPQEELEIEYNAYHDYIHELAAEHVDRWVWCEFEDEPEEASPEDIVEDHDAHVGAWLMTQDIPF